MKIELKMGSNNLPAKREGNTNTSSTRRGRDHTYDTYRCNDWVAWIYIL
jgi:hypothetical protein